ncbi:MAG: glycerol-3-phosphate dehydrogenase [Candidatus Berkiella sp.]
MSTAESYDLIVIGAGINGAGIAADAAGRGLSVLLCDQYDLASGTSSASSKLIHGGLRYLEHYDFSLVRKSLTERKILFQSAPHLVKPMRFAVPFTNTVRPFWLIRLGLYLYDLLDASFLFKRSKAISLKPTKNNPLKHTLSKGFVYTDCFVDDARLVVTNAIRAQQFGAKIYTRVKCLKAKRNQDCWEVHLHDQLNDKTFVVKSKALVNATGPWVQTLIDNAIQIPSKYRIRLVKGSHIVVPKLYDTQKAYLLEHKDGRVVFVIPYLDHYTMIGTTDVEHQGTPEQAKISLHEAEYLCEIVSEYFHHPLKASQIISSWSGVRPLVEDQSQDLAAINRDYKIEVITDEKNNLPLINLFGGKLTTYRLVAEQVVNALKPYFIHCKNPWTAHCPLPGGDLPTRNFELFLEKLTHDYPWLPTSLLKRYAQSYGTITYQLLNKATHLSDLGKDFGHGLYELELIYLVNHEWVKTTQDILTRRTKLGYFLSEQETDVLNQWFENYTRQHDPNNNAFMANELRLSL